MSQPDETVVATINFAVAPKDGSAPHQYASKTDPITGQRVRNFEYKTQEVQITNLRSQLTNGSDTLPTVDTAGFQFFTGYPSKHTKFVDDEEIEKEYYPESAELIKKHLGASRVLFFDHTIRRRVVGAADAPNARQPANGAHIDQTPKAAIARVHRHLPAEAEKLLSKRFQIVNLWRPVENPAFDWPLALCDFRSVNKDEDVMAVKLIYPHMEGETYAVKYNPNLKWNYLKGMTPDEFVLIKCFDSILDGSVAAFTPHTAFNDPSTPEGSPLRQSIELRALVFYD